MSYIYVDYTVVTLSDPAETKWRLTCTYTYIHVLRGNYNKYTRQGRIERYIIALNLLKGKLCANAPTRSK